jgi:hypothetical protein
VVADLCYLMLELGGLNSGKLGLGLRLGLGDVERTYSRINDILWCAFL